MPSSKIMTVWLTLLCVWQINVEIGNLRLFFINDCRELVPLIDARITSLSAQLTQVMPQVLLIPHSNPALAESIPCLVLILRLLPHRSKEQSTSS
jgi:hypothetical protein